MTQPIDYAETGFFDGAPSFPLRVRIERLAFLIVWSLLARWTLPRTRGWRRFLLQIFGAQIAPNANVYGSAKIWYPRNLVVGAHSVIGPGVRVYSMAPITIGRHVVVSQRAHLCCGSHDIHDPKFQLRAAPIEIGDDAWVCAESFVGPGVKVGEGAVIAARGATFTDIEPWTVYRGNPAVAVKSRTRFERPRT